MSSSRPDVHRLFERFGLDPQDYLSFGRGTPVATALGASVRADRVERSVRRVLDPALRAAQLRARLLGSLGG